MTKKEEQEIKDLVTSVDGEIVKVFDEFNAQLMRVFKPIQDTQGAVKINQQAIISLNQAVADLQSAVLRLNDRVTLLEQQSQCTDLDEPETIN
jgi:hypothetical protein